MNSISKIFPFLTKLAILCNGCFILSLIVMFVPKMSFPIVFSNFVAVLGLEMAPVMSLLFAVVYAYIRVKKLVFNLPSWQILVNILMLFFQLIFIFV